MLSIRLNCSSNRFTFKDKAEDIKDKVLWLMLENYRARIEQKALESVATEPADKHDDSWI